MIEPFHEELEVLRQLRDAFVGPKYRNALDLAVSAIRIVGMIRLKDLKEILKK